MRQGGGRAGPRRPGRLPLRVRLLAATLCLLAAGAAVIGVAGGLVASGYLNRQADEQLRGYAGRLTSRRFVVEPLYGLGPGTFSPDGPAGGAFGLEVRSSAGAVVLRAGLGTRLVPAIPAVSAQTAARAGQPVTVPASRGGSWRVITEPIHYQVRRIPFAYSADDFAVSVTGRARPGLAGTLVVGLDLGGIGHAVDWLAVTTLAAAGLAILAVAWLGARLLGAILRPAAGRQRAGRPPG